MNTKLAKQVLHKIQTTPNQWDQDIYHSYCGTQHCFAGWAEILSGHADPGTTDDTWTHVTARKALEIDQETSQYLFHTSRTLDDFEEFIGASPLKQSSILKKERGEGEERIERRERWRGGEKREERREEIFLRFKGNRRRVEKRRERREK